MSGDELNDLIEAIYDVVFDPGLMQTVLERMCALTDSEGGVLGFHSDRGVEHDEVFGCDPKWRATLCAFEHQNLYLQRRHRCRSAPQCSARSLRRMRKCGVWTSITSSIDRRVRFIFSAPCS